VYRLAYSGDSVRQRPDQLAVFQGASEAPISELIRAERVRQPPDGKTANRPRPRGVALKMGRRLSGACRIGYISI
jgi:hypothetical protein